MAVPKRLLILQKLTALLNTISEESGYNFTVTNKVHRGRNRFGDDTELPALAILEPPKQSDPVYAGAYQAYKYDWNILIQGWVKDKISHPTDEAYILAADVEKCLSQINAVDERGRAVNPAAYRLGGMITEFQMAPSIVRPPDELSDKAYFYLPVAITMTVDLADPFNTDEVK